MEHPTTSHLEPSSGPTAAAPEPARTGTPASRVESPPRPAPMSVRERWLVQTLLTFVIVGTNVAGAVITVAICAWVIPIPDGAEFSTVPNAIAVPLYVVFALVVGVIWGTKRLVLRLRWALDDRVPSEDEARAAVRLPLQLVMVHVVLWLGGAAALGLLNGLLEPETLPTVLFATVFVGLVVCGVAYLAAERLLRPIAARALAFITPGRVVIPGIAARDLMAWAVGSAIPVIGLLLVAVFSLVRRDATPTQLAVAILVIGGAMLFVGWLLNRFAARALLDPVQDLRAAIRRLEGGDLDVTVAVYDATEMGQLQSGFNQMVAGLREREHLRDLFGRHVGTDVAAQALTEPATLGGEVRDAAVLFVDLVRSTELAASRPPTEVVALLNRFFTATVEVVHDRGGWVNKFEGDGALAVFGTPSSLDDPAGAALHASRHLAARLLVDVPECRAGIGVAAGTVVAGNVGAEERFEYTVIGDPVNEAARLTEAAKMLPGGVASSADTVAAAHADEACQWVTGDEIVLRGRSAPTRLATPRELLDAPPPASYRPT